MSTIGFDQTSNLQASAGLARSSQTDPRSGGVDRPDSDAPQALAPAPESDPTSRSLMRVSARFGLAFTVCQLMVMAVMVTFVLPHGGSLSDPPDVRGRSILDAESVYRIGNYMFILAGSLLLGFMGAVRGQLARVDRSGVLATVATGAGTLLAVLWPMGGLLHDVALDVASAGTDVRILTGWDSIAPYALAFSVLPRVFFIGAIVIALRMSGRAPWLQRIGIVLIPLSLVGSATLVSGALFPLLALSTLGYEVWVGALAWHWLRASR